MDGWMFAVAAFARLFANRICCGGDVQNVISPSPYTHTQCVQTLISYRSQHITDIICIYAENKYVLRVIYWA